jgi:hypothetical protein
MAFLGRDNLPIKPPTATALMKLVVRKMPPDGNCLFWSLAYVGGDNQSAENMRSSLVRYAREHLDREFLHDMKLATWIEMLGEGNTDQYLNQMSRGGIWGGALEIAIAAEMFGRPIGIYEAKHHEGNVVASKMFEFLPQNPAAALKPPVFLLYSGRSHYDALDLVEIK